MAEEFRPTTSEAAAGSAKPADGPLEPGAPIPPDAVDPELIRLPMPLPRRHPGVAIAVLIVGVLLLYRLRTDLRYALQPTAATDIGDAASGLLSNQLQSALEKHLSLHGIPDHRNGLAFELKGGRTRTQVFRLLGTGSRVFIATPVQGQPPFVNSWSGRLRRFDDLSFAETLRNEWKKTQISQAVDLSKLKALPAGTLPSPLTISDRAGQVLHILAQQDLLIDVLFDDDVRVLLSKDKFPSEADARREVERLRLAHGPGVETRDGYGYVLRLPPKGLERQLILALIDAQGIWLWHRIEPYRVPAGAVQLTPAGLVLPGPDALQQPVRYMEQEVAGGDSAGARDATAPRQLVAQKDPSTLLLWEQIQAVQVSENFKVPSDALLLMAGETPKTQFYTLPLSALLLLFMSFNVWYLRRSWRRPTA